MCVYSLSSCFEMEGERRKKKKCLVRLKVFFKHRKNSKNAHLPRIARGRYIIIGIIIVRFQSGCRLLSVAQTRDSEWVNDIKPAASLSRETSPRFLRGVVYRDYHKKRNEPSTRITSCSLHFELAEQYESLQRLLNTNSLNNEDEEEEKERKKKNYIEIYSRFLYFAKREFDWSPTFTNWK